MNAYGICVSPLPLFHFVMHNRLDLPMFYPCRTLSAYFAPSFTGPDASCEICYASLPASLVACLAVRPFVGNASV